MLLIRRTGAQIHSYITNLITDPTIDVDGDSDIDANDSFLINLVINGGTDADITNNKGASALTAVEIRNNINELVFNKKLGYNTVKSTQVCTLTTWSSNPRASVPSYNKVITWTRPVINIDSLSFNVS